MKHRREWTCPAAVHQFEHPAALTLCLALAPALFASAFESRSKSKAKTQDFNLIPCPPNAATDNTPATLLNRAMPLRTGQFLLDLRENRLRRSRAHRAQQLDHLPRLARIPAQHEIKNFRTIKHPAQPVIHGTIHDEMDAIAVAAIRDAMREVRIDLTARARLHHPALAINHGGCAPMDMGNVWGCSKAVRRAI